MQPETTTRLTVRLQDTVAEKNVSQTINQVINEPDEAAILALGDIMASLEPNAKLLSVTEIVQREYVH